MSEQNIYEKFVKALQFDVSEYLDSELTEFQTNLIEEATLILKDNIVGAVKKFGGNYDKNKQKFDSFIKKAEKELEKKENSSIQKQFLKNYSKKLIELIEKSCVAIIPVKDMPWVEVLFRSVPRLAIFDKKVELTDTSIAYYGEIKCVISKTTIFGKMRDKESLFAPIIGELDLGGYKLEDPKKEPKSEIYSYISAVINTLDSTITRNQLEKYHEGYQRHGEPICDFLMSKKDLFEAMENGRSGLESDRIKSNVAVCSIAIPLFGDKSTLLLVIDDGDDKNSKKFTRCFEALLKFSAICCEAPTTKKAEDIQKESTPQRLTATHAQGSQELKSWTEEELKETQKRDGTIPEGMSVWTEEDLIKAAEERGAGVPEGMEVWTEKELEELARKRQGGGLDIPEWIPDSSLVECSKCGYSLKKSWSECPICGVKIGSTASKPVEKSTEESDTEAEKEESENEKEDDESKEDEEKVEEEDEKKEDESNLL